MKRKLLLLIFVMIAFKFAFWSRAFACTNIVVKAKNGAVVVGRTLEFGPNLNSQIMTMPIGHQFTTRTPSGKPGLSWTNRYGYVYLNYFGVNRAVDGMNNQGLSYGALYLPGYTEYPKVKPGQNAEALAYDAFGDWVLGNFKTVAAVKRALKHVVIFAQPVTVEGHKNIVFPLHMIITDASGKSITVEFHDGAMQVYDNKTGVMTNSPTYDWQLNNLKNYANLSPYSPAPIKVDGYTYLGTGQGAGAVGLPGDFTPPSRFVKMTFLSQYSYPVSNAKRALNLAQHIINDVDIPYGVVRAPQGQKASPDKTQWTVFKDLKNHVLYFKSYDNTTLQSVKLDNLNLAKDAPVQKMPVNSQQIIVDATAKLLPQKS